MAKVERLSDGSLVKVSPTADGRIEVRDMTCERMGYVEFRAHVASGEHGEQCRDDEPETLHVPRGGEYGPQS